MGVIVTVEKGVGTTVRRYVFLAVLLNADISPFFMYVAGHRRSRMHMH